MWPPAIKLGVLLELASNRCEPEGWLYLPDNWHAWCADTPAYMLQVEDDDNEERIDAEATERGYSITIDNGTLEEIVYAARTHLNSDLVEVRIEALVYYVQNDAFLPSIGAPDPPPWEEAQRESDRKFYDSLGAESSDSRCRASGCTRGAVALSVLCRTHHFEQVRGRPCPFND